MKRIVWPIIIASVIAGAAPSVYAQQMPNMTVGGSYTSSVPILSDKQANNLRYDVRGRLITTVEKRATYSAAITGLVPAAAATDIFCVQGSATKVIIVKHLAISGVAGTNIAMDLQVLKRSTANTGGTSTSPTPVSHDSTNAAATATIYAYTANPTTGTLVGVVDSAKLTLGVTTNNQSNERNVHYGAEEDQGIVLRGTAEEVCMNFNGGTATTPTVNIAAEWREITE